MFPSEKLFDDLSLKIGQLFYGRTISDPNGISKVLDDLNSLNYRSPVVQNPTKAILLINQCCTSIQVEDEILVPKCAQLIVNLIKNQNVSVEGRTLTISVQWCLESTRNFNRNVTLESLRALEALIRNNVQKIPIPLLDRITEKLKKEINLEAISKNTENSKDILQASIQCLEASTVTTPEVKSWANFLGHFEKCAEIFVSFLCLRKNCRDSVADIKNLETCLIGLQNITFIHQEYLKRELGLILGIIKSYMLYNVRDIEFLTPEILKPSKLSIPEVTHFGKEKTGGKVTKQRKHRNTPKKKKKTDEENHFEPKSGGYVPATTVLEYNSDSGIGQASNSRLKTSDSDFSDNEGGKLAKISHSSNKVRQAALNLFSTVIKPSEKSTIFTYWSNFIPESSSSGKHNLLMCIHKDPSTRGKMCALNVLLLLLTSAKMYLMQAESSEKASSFTSFSVSLGLTLTELHKNLCLALNQFNVPVLAQVLKCVASLVQATPYHRMSNGLITKLVRNVKTLVWHRDASVQVTALIVTGCILAFEPPLPETLEVMIKIENKKEVQGDANQAKNDDFDFAQFSSDEEEDNNAEIDSMPWLLYKCLKNLGIKFANDKKTEQIVPAPVKLESLQVLSAMSRNYFENLMFPHLNSITKALELSLLDKHSDLRLHGGRAVEFLGQAIAKMNESDLSRSVCLNFWQTLLNGPLVLLIQNEQHAALRAIGCDCLGSIGTHIFQQLPRDKQILCVTLLFASTKDEEHTVRGAAVRALALCVLYPSLREDPGFVQDTAESILQALKDDNVNVRVKASWSLGNLSDALVLNNKSCDSPEDIIPERILVKLFEASIKSVNDNEKIKMNVVRAIGNLLQLMDDDILKQERFKDASEQGLNALVKAGTSGVNMKVRWNACYALSNALKNPSIYTNLDLNTWQASAFTKLSELVVSFKNFKVRINAALALSAPTAREHYGLHFIPLWSSMLQALENSQNIDDFMEYKHRDHLVEQVCLCLGHLTTLLIKDDLPQLETILNLYLDTFKTHMRKVAERLVPEKSTELFSASCYLANLEPNVNGTNEKKVIAILRTIFVPQ